ncbi:protein EARLY FLOWERING 3-like isoform X3 [Corylus avellana]|uniref:protein EARLY FLOWERING 3-like isoform X3 n=1 Tax=Corylus avellana TaxID=13451 RepID=UPI00286D6206|nr:protein EARLY FLOWERING 3-like isoform X3 [Corylus avellana]
MRGRKDEEKLVSPMFPRLHVNDTEKGGPRAPPRNKMALYEQFSIPSQGFTSGSASMLPILPSNGSSLTPLMSSSYVGAHQRSMFTPFGNSPSPSHLAEKLNSYSFSGVKSNTVMANHEQNSTKPTSYRSFNATGLSSSTLKCESSQSYNFSNFKNLSSKKLGDEDGRVPTTGQGITPHCDNSQYRRGREKPPRLSLSSLVKHQNVCDKNINGDGTIDLNSIGFLRKQTGEDSKVSPSNQDPVERSASITSSRNNLVDTSSIPSTKVKNSESLKRKLASSDRENRSSSVDNLNRLQGTNAQSQQAYVAVKDRTAARDDMVVPRIGVPMENASKLRSKSCSRPSLGDDYRSLNVFVSGSECCEDKRCGSVQVVDRHDNVSDADMVETMLAVDISPDDVVGVIGEKLFWKARSAIVNQQRVFALQVFELHRLIKVQRMMAGSPQLLLEDNLYLGKRSTKVSPPVKKLVSEYVAEPPAPLIVKANDDSMKSNPKDDEYTDESAVGKFPLPFVNYDNSKGLATHQSNDGLHLANPALTPLTTSTKPAPWCFHPPPGNQWLVPAMSPSEGLVYKPYTGPCLPTSAFMLNTVYSVPAPILPGTPPLGQTYFSLYGLPVMNQSVSSSGVEETSPFAGAQSNRPDNQLMIGDINFTIPQQSSCNMSSEVTRVISCHAGKFPASKESELQGSAASSPSYRAKGDDALPLFPTTPTAHALMDQNVQTSENRTQVIKVVPHNPRSATESAFRIFRSIQEERKQL